MIVRHGGDVWIGGGGAIYEVHNGGSNDLQDYQVAISGSFPDRVSVDVGGKTAPYWFEDSNKFWTKVDVPAGGSVEVLVLNDRNSTKVSNGEEVFEFFDNFDSDSLDTNKWQTVCESGDYCDVQNGYLRVGEGSHDNDGMTVATKNTLYFINRRVKIAGKMWKVYTGGSTWEADPEVGFSNTVLQNLQGGSGYTKVAHYLGDSPSQSGQNHAIKNGDNNADVSGSSGVAYNVDGGTFEEELFILPDKIIATLKRGDGWNETITLNQAPAISDGYWYINTNGLGDSTYSVYGLMIDWVLMTKFIDPEPTVSLKTRIIHLS